MQELVHTHATHREGGVLPGLLVHLDLPEPTLQIHAREVSGAHHAFHGFLHMWQGIGVLFGPGVQVTKVNTEPKRPIFFSHEHNSIAPGQLRGSDSTAIQHFLDMLAHLVHQRWGNTAKPFFEWFILHQLDDVLSGVGTPNLIWLQGEDMVELQQQGFCPPG